MWNIRSPLMCVAFTPQIPLAIYVIFALVILLPCVEGRFTITACWNENCVQHTNVGWCYVPSAGQTTAVSCTGGYARDANMQSVLAVHLQQGLSIAYYSGADNSLLGGADWSIPANPGIIRLCLSGRAGDGSYQTMCENIAQDNDIYGWSGDPFCLVALGQDQVSDGCYIPQSGTNSNIISIHALISATGATTNSTSISTSLTAATTSTPVVVSTLSHDNHAPSTPISSGIEATSVSSSTISPPALTTVLPNNKYMENVVVPIVVAVLGVVSAALGGGWWWNRRRMRAK